jgi:hypothetical protein
MRNSILLPRPEYPRPDRQRGQQEGVDWLNLNGPWAFRFDGDNCGVAERWFAAHPGDMSTHNQWSEQIIVPFCWESLAAWGEGDAAGNDNYYSTRVFRDPLRVNKLNHRSAPRYEIGWYRREVVIPANEYWENKRVILTVGAADFFTDGWCNGVHLGRHEGGYTPFEFDITDALHTRPDGTRIGVLVLRVEDPMDNAQQPVGKQWSWYTTTSGIWQTVFVEPRHASHIRNFRIVPDIDTSSAQFLIHCEEAENCYIEIEIQSPDACAKVPAKKTRIAVTDGIAEGWSPVDPLLLWDVNHPHLYDVTLRLCRDDHTLDEVETYFGMRSIDAAHMGDNPNAPMALRINGVPRYLRGALYQSYYPEGVYTAGDASTLKHDIDYAKRVGFNFLRVHIKVDDPLLLYYADKMGMLLMCDFPNFGEGGDTPLGRERFEYTMRKAIERDFNHPSIVAWCLFNETWGFGGQVELVKLFPGEKQNDAEAKMVVVESSESEVIQKAKLDNHGSHAWVQHIWEEAKVLDNTRLIEDMSVVYWDHLEFYGHGDTDINSWHFYINDYAKAREHIEKIAKETTSGSNLNFVPGYEQDRQPLINSEYGGVGALDGDRDISWSFRFLTSELRRQGSICAYIFTELTDVEWEYNGFLQYDRTPKEFGYDPRIINSADVLPIDAPPISLVAPGENVEVKISSSHYATKPLKDVSLQWRLSGVDTLGRVHQNILRGQVAIPYPHGRVAHAHTLNLTMPETPMLCTLHLEAVTAEGELAARNYLEYSVCESYPMGREENGGSVILRARPQDWSDAWWSEFQAPREDTEKKDYAAGRGHGFYEWALPLDGINLWEARRLRVLVEASSSKIESSQTNIKQHPTVAQILLNGAVVYAAKIPNHPHDSRGSLSYLHLSDSGGRGEHGYLLHATVEGNLLREVAERTGDSYLRLRCAVPGDAFSQGGLTIYGAQSGRYPVPPTIIVEW